MVASVNANVCARVRRVTCASFLRIS